MIHSPRFTAVLDANVIYPAPVRDLLLNLADLEIFSPKWSEIIHEEWIRNLLNKRADLSKSKLIRTVKIMNSAFPDAEVYGFEELIEGLELPDLDDRHVLAVAVHSKADAIITFNQKDFPSKYLKEFSIDVYSPDKFLDLLHKLSPEIVNKAFLNQLPSEIQSKGRRKLRMISNSQDVNDLRVPPGNRLEKLKGDLSDYYSIRINNQWRIIFQWKGSDSYEVSIVDYH